MKNTAEVRERLTKVFDGLEKNIAELPRAKQLTTVAGRVIATLKLDLERDIFSSRKKK